MLCYARNQGENVSALLKALEAITAPGCVVLLVAKVRSALDAWYNMYRPNPTAIPHEPRSISFTKTSEEPYSLMF